MLVNFERYRVRLALVKTRAYPKMAQPNRSPLLLTLITFALLAITGCSTVLVSSGTFVGHGNNELNTQVINGKYAK